MCLQDGYKLIRADQLLAAIAALNDRRISFRAFRAFFASFELVARREAAERTRVRGSKARQRRFRREELRDLVEPGAGPTLSREIRLLRASGLMVFTERAIEFTSDASPGLDQGTLLAGRPPSRLIPVPRQVLKFLAASRKPALARTVVAYLLRGLALDRTGVVRSKGAVKISWICRLCRISERAARSARAELVRLGWITKDTGSFQRKLNRDGAYFVINTAWGRVAKRIAPPRRPNRVGFAPPRERRETLSDLKNRKPATRSGAGVQGTGGRPDLRNIGLEDLRRISRLKDLFRQANEAGWIDGGDAAFLNFTAAAVRATRVAGDPVRIFVGIVRRRLWHVITLEQEARAIEVIRRDRDRGAARKNIRDLLRRVGWKPGGDTPSSEPPLLAASPHCPASEHAS